MLLRVSSVDGSVCEGVPNNWYGIKMGATWKQGQTKRTFVCTNSRLLLYLCAECTLDIASLFSIRPVPARETSETLINILLVRINEFVINLKQCLTNIIEREIGLLRRQHVGRTEFWDKYFMYCIIFINEWRLLIFHEFIDLLIVEATVESLRAAVVLHNVVGCNC